MYNVQGVSKENNEDSGGCFRNVDYGFLCVYEKFKYAKIYRIYIQYTGIYKISKVPSPLSNILLLSICLIIFVKVA